MKDGVRTPCFYVLPKIQKDLNSFPPLQPICSGINSCAAKISEFVDIFLRPAAQQNPSYLRDSSIEHRGTSTVFYMMDQYFGNDSLEPFESKFIGSTGS